MTPTRPSASSEAVRRRLSRQKARDTQPELILRRELFRRGLRYRVNYPVPGNRRRTIDIAFPSRRLAVFVDGCFWHACPQHSVAAKANAGWWLTKLKSNVERDRQTTQTLESEGWCVVRLWEHDLRDDDSAVLAASRVQYHLG